MPDAQRLRPTTDYPSEQLTGERASATLATRCWSVFKINGFDTVGSRRGSGDATRLTGSLVESSLL